jgi:hypothetical protein
MDASGSQVVIQRLEVVTVLALLSTSFVSRFLRFIRFSPVSVSVRRGNIKFLCWTAPISRGFALRSLYSYLAKMSALENEKVALENEKVALENQAPSLSDESLTNPTGIDEKALVRKLDLRLLPPLTLLYLLSFLDRSNSMLPALVLGI